MSRAPRLLALLATAFVLASGCTTPPAEGPSPQPPSPAPGPGPQPAPSPAPGPADNFTGGSFAWDLLRALRGEEPGANLFLSPVSVAAALCLALEGAEGATRSAIAYTLGLSDDAERDCRALSAALTRSRNASGAVVDVANSAWIRDTFAPAVEPAFLDALREDFRAGAFVRPFDEATVDELNAWVANATRGMIPMMLEGDLPDDLVVMLANAIFFEGRWAARFDANLTTPGDFHLAGGATVQVPMMRNATARNVSLAAGDGFRAARIPYADGDHAMVILLPDRGRTVDEVASSLTDDTWPALAGRMRRESAVNLSLPKFELSWGAELKDALSGMGMAVAFDRGAADFRGIADVSPERLYLSFVKHMAALEVDEEGTRAAAATVVGVGMTSLPPPPPEFHVDRPFVLAIVDDEVAMPLFLGVVEDPSAG